MHAWVARDGQASLESRPIPTAGPLDVVVRTTAASVCSADVACLTGEFDVPDGLVLGHEAVGVVHEVGSLVDGFAPGQRVAVASTTPCGTCQNCQRGHGGHCGTDVWGGYSFGISRDGTLAEYFVVPFAAINLVHIPDDVTDADAVCVTDTIASGSTGPETANMSPGGVAVIVGQGHVGLAATMSSRTFGAGLVIAVRATPGGEALATSVGADVALNLAEHDVVAEILKLTDGVGADCVIEASGATASFPTAVQVTREGGTVVVLSSYSGPPDTTLDIPLQHWGWGIGDKTIVSSFQRCGSERMSRLLRLVQNGRLDCAPLVTHEFAFARADTALDGVATRQPGLVKPLITF